MKRFWSVLLSLVILLSATAVPAETQGEKFQWGAYMLEATWLTTDPKEINIPNMRNDGLFVLIRLNGAGTPVKIEDIRGIQEKEFVLIDAEGNEYGIATWMVHKLINPEGGGFPTMAPEQECFDLLFFLEGKAGEAAVGARMRVGDQLIDLDGIPRELPANE